MYPSQGFQMKELVRAFKAHSDQSRLRILKLISCTGETCVCDIEAITGFTQTKTLRPDTVMGEK